MLHTVQLKLRSPTKYQLLANTDHSISLINYLVVKGFHCNIPYCHVYFFTIFWIALAVAFNHRAYCLSIGK